MSSRVVLQPKLLGETRSYTFDFGADLAAGETISTQTTTVSVYSGVDPSPSSVVNGSATASGTVVTQSLTGGVLGVQYEVLVTITTSLSQTLERVGYLAVVQDLP